MATSFDPRTIASIIDLWENWRDDKRMEQVLAFIAELGDHEPMVVAQPSEGDVLKGSVVLAIFTARAALRKAYHWFDDSRNWSHDQRAEFMLPMMREMIDALTNCNTAMVELNLAGSPIAVPFGAGPGATEGGAS